MIIALFAVSEQSIAGNIVLIFVMTVFLYLQYLHNPFISHQANKMEFILLVCSVLIMVLRLSLTPGIDNDIMNIIISALILLPFVLIIYYTSIEVRIRYKSDKKDGLQQGLLKNDVVAVMDDDGDVDEKSSDDERMIKTINYVLNDNEVIHRMDYQVMRQKYDLEHIELDDIIEKGDSESLVSLNTSTRSGDDASESEF